MIDAGLLEAELKKIEGMVVDADSFDAIDLGSIRLPEPVKGSIESAIKGLFHPWAEREGLFITITGIDRSGKETHAFNPKGLKGVVSMAGMLRSMGFETLGVRQPSYDTLLGRLVASYLGKEKLIDGELSKDTAWILWSLDRAQHNPRIIEWLRSGRNAVLAKRWCESNLVYKYAQGIDPGRVMRFEERIVKQDYTIVLDLPVEQAIERAGGGADLYESPGFLERVRRLYMELPRLYPYGEIYLVDASRGIDEVNRDLIGLLQRLIEGHR